jgi:hypothetical protein
MGWSLPPILACGTGFRTLCISCIKQPAEFALCPWPPLGTLQVPQCDPNAPLSYARPDSQRTPRRSAFGPGPDEHFPRGDGLGGPKAARDGPTGADAPGGDFGGHPGSRGGDGGASGWVAAKPLRLYFPSQRIESFRFSDGAIWGESSILARLQVVAGL